MKCVFDILSCRVSTKDDNIKQELLELQKMCWNYRGYFQELQNINDRLAYLYKISCIDEKQYYEIRRALDDKRSVY